MPPGCQAVSPSKGLNIELARPNVRPPNRSDASKATTKPSTGRILRDAKDKAKTDSKMVIRSNHIVVETFCSPSK